MARGQVKNSVYKSYVAAASLVGVVGFLFATFAAQGTSILGNLSVGPAEETPRSELIFDVQRAESFARGERKTSRLARLVSRLR